MAGLHASLLELGLARAKFDLVLEVTDPGRATTPATQAAQHTLQASFTYAAALFNAATIAALAEHFLARFNRRMNLDLQGFDPDAEAVLRCLPYPGNVRELENIVERAVALEMGERIGATDVEEARADKRLAVFVYPGLGYQSVNFNVGNGPRANTPMGRSALVRKAFEASIDRETIYLYDNYPGGIGFSEPLFSMHDELLSRTRELIGECPCASGCPSCVGPEGATGPHTKKVAQDLLGRLSA